MDFSPYCGYFLVPNECAGCTCMDVVKVSTPFYCLASIGGAVVDTAPTTPQVTTPQSLVGEGRSGILRPTTAVPH